MQEGLSASSLSPQATVPITTDGSVYTSVIVSGVGADFMAIWGDGSEGLVASFSNNQGQSWSSGSFPMGYQTYFTPWVGGNSSGFVVTWAGPSVGILSGVVYTLFYNIKTSQWGSVQVANIDANNILPKVAAIEDGFLITCWNVDVEDLESRFSTDGETWQPGNSLPAPQSGNSLVPNMSPMIVGTPSGSFVATWQEIDIGSLLHYYSSYLSAPFTGAWSSAVEIPHPTTLEENVNCWIGANNQGVLAVWVDVVGNIYSSFSSDLGTNWVTSNTPIASNAINNVSVSGIGDNFIISWADSSFNAVAAISSDKGQTWQTPVTQLVSDGSVNSANQPTADVNCVCASCSSQGCMFTWLDASNNGQSSFSPFSVSSNSLPRKPGVFSPFFQAGSLNQRGHFFNH
jgi:hypothetical protein